MSAPKRFRFPARPASVVDTEWYSEKKGQDGIAEVRPI
jgi:hypothetical protein